MPTQRGSTTTASGSATTATVDRPTGLTTDDVVVICAVVESDDTPTWTLTAGLSVVAVVKPDRGFSMTVIAGTGFTAGGTFSLNSGLGSAWKELICTAWADADSTVVAGAGVWQDWSGPTPQMVIPSVDAARADATVLAFARQEFRQMASTTTPATTLLGTANSTHGRVRTFGSAGPVGALTWPPEDEWGMAAGIQVVVDAPAGGDDKTTAGHTGVALAVTGTARKVAGATGGLGLGLGTGDDTTKTGHTAGPVDALVDVDGTGAKASSTAGTVPLDVAVAAATLAERITVGHLDLDLDVAGTSTKQAHAAAALALALDLAADPAKAAHVAAELGLTLDVLGAARAIVDGQVDGHIALALAVVATATKHTATTGALGLALDADGDSSKRTTTAGSTGLDLGVDGTARPVDGPSASGHLGLYLDTAGAGAKRAAVVATLDLVLGIAGRARDAGFTLPPPARIVTVAAQDRTVLAPARPRTVDAAPHPRLVVKESSS